MRTILGGRRGEDDEGEEESGNTFSGSKLMFKAPYKALRRAIKGEGGTES